MNRLKTDNASFFDRIHAAAQAGVSAREKEAQLQREKEARAKLEAEERVTTVIQELINLAEKAGRWGESSVLVFSGYLAAVDPALPNPSVLNNHQRAVLDRLTELGLTPAWHLHRAQPGQKGYDKWELRVGIDMMQVFDPEPQSITDRIDAMKKRQRLNDPAVPFSERMAIAYSIGSAQRSESERRAVAEKAKRDAEAAAHVAREVDRMEAGLLAAICGAAEAGAPTAVAFSVAASDTNRHLDSPEESELPEARQAFLQRLRQAKVHYFWRFEPHQGTKRLPEWECVVLVPPVGV